MKKNQAISRRQRASIFLFFSGFSLLSDQATKLLAQKYLLDKIPYSPVKFIHLHYIENHNGFLGIYSGSSSFTKAITLYLLPISLLIACTLAIIFWQNLRRYHCCLASIIVGSASSNIVDRFIHGGGVIDYIQLQIHFWQSGIGNLADIFIIGAAFLWGFSFFASNSQP